MSVPTTSSGPMAETMIERVAVALRPFMAEGPDAGNAARAAIEVMREPTEVMMASCGQILSHFEGDYGDHNVYFRPHQAEEIWQAMIDTALAE